MIPFASVIAILAFSLVQISLGLMCYKQEIHLFNEKHAIKSQLEQINCDRSCHVITKGREVHGMYIITAGCDAEGPSSGGCQIREDEVEHCTCYTEGCNLPDIMQTREKIKAKEYLDRPVKCNTFIAYQDKGQVAISTQMEVICMNACHTTWLQSESIISAFGSCAVYGVEAGDCKLVGDQLECVCSSDLCNTIPDDKTFDEFAEKWAVAQTDKKVRMCKQFKGSFNQYTGEIQYDEKYTVGCASNCTTVITKDNIRVFSIEGNCDDEKHKLNWHATTVAEKSGSAWFVREIEKTYQSCAAYNDGSRTFLECTCDYKHCNDPIVEELRFLIDDYHKHVSR